MPQPLLEPAVMMAENCPECRGVGCDACEGSGRQISEIPLSLAQEMLAKAQAQLVSPPPSELRRRALDDAADETVVG